MYLEFYSYNGITALCFCVAALVMALVGVKALISKDPAGLFALFASAILYLFATGASTVHMRSQLKESKVTIESSYFSEKSMERFNEKAGKAISWCLELDTSEDLQLITGVCSVENKKVIYKNLKAEQVNQIRAKKADFSESSWANIDSLVDKKVNLVAKRLTLIGGEESLNAFKLYSSVELPNFSESIGGQGCCYAA